MPTAPPAVIRAAGIALAIAVGVVFSSPGAIAGCGEHVHIVGQPTGVCANATILFVGDGVADPLNTSP